MAIRTVTYPRLTWLRAELKNRYIPDEPRATLLTELNALIFRYRAEVHGTFATVPVGSQSLHYWRTLQKVAPWRNDAYFKERLRYLHRTKAALVMSGALANFYDAAVSRREKEKKS